MDTKNFNVKVLSFIILAGIVTILACQKEEEYPRTRLFQPVLNQELFAIGNTIVVDLGKMVDAENYTVEVSIDSFQTVDYTIQSDTNYIIINEELIGEELLWFFIYQVRVTAHADDPEYNSLPSDLGSVRTEKFPSNMRAPAYFDILDTRARVFWTPVGDPISKIKVFEGSDLRLSTPLAEHIVTLRENLEGEKIIEGLSPSTSYQIAIYSGQTVRGWEEYLTREASISGDNVIDLTGMSSPVQLITVLPGIEDGSIVVMEGGTTYFANGYEFDKSVSFVAGYSFVPELPVIDCSENFNIVDGSNVGYVTFKDIHLMASNDGYNARYVFNLNVSANIGEIKFESCMIKGLRGVFRMKDTGPGILEKYTITGCQIDSIRDYGILTVDMNNWQCNEILIENSSITQTIAFIQSRNNSSSVTIDGCTIHESPETGRDIFRYREVGQDDVFNGITVSNTIWGHAWNTAEDGNYMIDGFDGLGNTNFTIINTYATSEFAFDPASDAIPGFPTASYSGSVTDLWTDPYNSIFDFKDLGFSGKGDSGDPRWRIGL